MFTHLDHPNYFLQFISVLKMAIVLFSCQTEKENNMLALESKRAK
jgi:hypothetical protein